MYMYHTVINRLLLLCVPTVSCNHTAVYHFEFNKNEYYTQGCSLKKEVFGRNKKWEDAGPSQGHKHT